MTPRLSICIPTYNRLPYLRELMADLLPQVDAVASGTVELCVSDNASTDGTAAYLKTLSSPSLRHWTNRTNVGGDRNFLVCIREAHGDYVWLVGDDDLTPEGSVERVLRLLEQTPDLVIADEFSAETKTYPDYRSCLLGEAGRKSALAITHTLITANIFRRSLFDLSFAEAKLWTSYAHMFGFIGHVKGRVVIAPNLIATRAVRAEFAKYPSFLCLKHAYYLNHLATTFGLPSYRWKAVRSALNLPLEFGSRVKHYLKKGVALCSR